MAGPGRRHEAEKESKSLWVFKFVIVPLFVAVVGGLAVYFAIELIRDDDAPPKVRIDTAASLLNPAGSDDPSGEYVCLVNEEDSAVDLTGWKLTDAEGVVNVLPQLSLGAHATVRVHPGGGDERADTAVDLYGSEGTTWNNGGDTVTLYDADGEEVDSRPYPERDDGEVRGRCGPVQPGGPG